jgi:hypothetical protein
MLLVADSSNFSCTYNGEFYAHNTEFKPNACTSCVCEKGHIRCSKVECPLLDCEVKQSLTSECCPVCTGECLSTATGKVYKSNETWREDNDCIQCTCINGKKLCNAELCEKPKCKNPVKIAGICCLACTDDNEQSGKRINRVHRIQLNLLALFILIKLIYK